MRSMQPTIYTESVEPHFSFLTIQSGQLSVQRRLLLDVCVIYYPISTLFPHSSGVNHTPFTYQPEDQTLHSSSIPWSSEQQLPQCPTTRSMHSSRVLLDYHFHIVGYHVLFLSLIINLDCATLTLSISKPSPPKYNHTMSQTRCNNCPLKPIEARVVLSMQHHFQSIF